MALLKKILVVPILLLCTAGYVSAQTSTNVLEIEEEPSVTDLLSKALVVGLYDYAFQLILHEGTHMTAIRLAGGKVNSLDLLPSVDPVDGTLRFGYVEYTYDPSEVSGKERGWIAIAPQLVNASLLSIYSTSYEMDLLPRSKSAQLGITMLALGASLDLLKDLLDNRKGSDTATSFREWDLNYHGRLTVRSLQLVVLTISFTQIFRSLYYIFSNDVGLQTKPKWANTYGSPFLSYKECSINAGWRITF